MTCCSRKIIEQIKIVGKIENVAARNAVNYEDGYLEFGGPLIHDTVVNGNFKLSFGDFTGNLSYFSVSSNSTVYLEANNGAVGSFINIENSKILIGSSSPTSGGLMGLHDYRAGMTDGRYYVQKIYVDNVIAGRPAVTNVTNPGASEHTKSIAWNNDIQHWTMQSAGAAPSAGADTQVIHNIGGALVGNTSFTFNPANPSMSVPHIELGHLTFAGSQRVIIARSSDAYAHIILEPQGQGSLWAYLTTGALIIGSPGSTSLVQRIQAQGSQPQVDIALETKGPDGIVFLGDKDEVGAFRRIAPRGYNASINMMIQSKGAGNVILDPDPSNSYDHAWVKIGHGSRSLPGIRTRRFYADSDWVTTNLEIGGNGLGHTLLLGTSDELASTRFLTAASAAADCNINIYGKGAGLVAINGFVRSKKIAIVNWNMNSTGGVSIAHGFGINDWTKIISIEVVVRNDFGGDYGPLGRIVAAGVVEGGVAFWDNAAVYINRRVGGIFQSSIYDSTGGYVRGWIYINYEL